MTDRPLALRPPLLSAPIARLSPLPFRSIPTARSPPFQPTRLDSTRLAPRRRPSIAMLSLLLSATAAGGDLLQPTPVAILRSHANIVDTCMSSAAKGAAWFVMAGQSGRGRWEERTQRRCLRRIERTKGRLSASQTCCRLSASSLMSVSC